MKKIIIVILAVLALWTLGGMPAHATNPTDDPPLPVEVCATWKVIDSDGNGDIWEQNILSKDCSYAPPAECEPYQIQFDKYWIRDAEDAAYFESLTVLYSPADDARLDPHGYYVETIPAKDCTVPPIEPPTEPPVEIVPPTEVTPAPESTETLAATGSESSPAELVMIFFLSAGVTLLAIQTFRNRKD